MRSALQIWTLAILLLAASVPLPAKTPQLEKATAHKKAGARPVFDSSQLQRLDPHGSAQLKLTAELLTQDRACEVCHTGNELHPPEKLVAESCANCHNQRPHSGLVEHLNKKDITCVSCHNVHRAGSIEWSVPSQRFSAFRVQELATGESVKPSSHPMLKKNCRDCHKW